MPIHSVYPRLVKVAVALVCAAVLSSCGDTAEPVAVPEEVGDAPAADFPRTVDHAMGSTDIPERPERVVVLDTGELDSALSLGVTPVGAVTTAVDTRFLSYLEEDAAEVQAVGTIPAPNLEAIASLHPDLILSNKVRHEELYDELSQIAPTVFAEAVGAPWKDNLRLASEAMGLGDEAEAGISDYEQEAAELGETLGDPSATTVSALRFVEGSIRAYSEESFIGTVLGDIGVSRPELPPGEFDAFTELSPEQLDLADADVLLYAPYGAVEDSGQLGVLAGPLWPRLGAVERGQAFLVEDDVFYSGIGLGAASLIVADLRQRLAG